MYGFIVPPRRAGQSPGPVTIESRGKTPLTTSEVIPILPVQNGLRWVPDGLRQGPGLSPSSARQDHGQAGGGEFLTPFPLHPRLALLSHRPGSGWVAEQLGDARRDAGYIAHDVAG